MLNFQSILEVAGNLSECVFLLKRTFIKSLRIKQESVLHIKNNACSCLVYYFCREFVASMTPGAEAAVEKILGGVRS